MKKTVMKRRLLCALTVVCMVCGLTGCRVTPSNTSYTVTVQSEGGMPLADVRVNVYDQDDPSDLIWAGMTNENGSTISFVASEDVRLEVKVSEFPDGYTAQDMYPLTQSETTVRLSSSLRDGELSAQTWKLGDIMCDFTLRAGNEDVTLSQLLKTKKAVVLNFWFEGCGPCRAEFPYLEKAYKAYAQDLEIFAINPYDGTAASVQAYAAALGLTFPMMKGEDAWQTAFNVTAFPTTVVIDRYGMIAMMHRGSITEEGVFEKIFAHFLSEDYVQGTVRNISDLG